jgi:four helix bundle protein
MQDFRRLDVWKRAHSFAVNVRRTTRVFPRTGYSDLKSQLTRAAESIAGNIVEGCAAATPKEFARYLDFAIKSTSEAESQLQLAKDYGIVGPQTWAVLSREAVEIRKMLFGLRRSVLVCDQTAPKSPKNRPNRRATRHETRSGQH